MSDTNGGAPLEIQNAAKLVLERAAKQAPVIVKATAAGASEPLSDRLACARVDLVAYIENGIPPREWLPASANMLIRGKRHHVSAPMKSGKSLAFLAHAVDMVLAGATVAILDRENGEDEYARRLADVLEARPAAARDAVRERLRYYGWPQLKLDEDRRALAAAFDGVDLVIFDSSRTFLTSVSLTEGDSDEYARFVGALIEPLFIAGTATLILDNTGHGDQDRARGTSSKGDLADLVFNLKTSAKFDKHTTGEVRLVCTNKRAGDAADGFAMRLGGGVFESFVAKAPIASDVSAGPWRPTRTMQVVSEFLESRDDGASKNTVEESVPGRRETIRAALATLVTEEYVSEHPEGRSLIHRSVRPYRENTDPLTSPIRPDLAPTSPGANRSATSPIRPTPIGAKGGGEPTGDTTPEQLAPRLGDAA